MFVNARLSTLPGSGRLVAVALLVCVLGSLSLASAQTDLSLFNTNIYPALSGQRDDGEYTCADTVLDCEGGRITAIRLSRSGLRGSIPTDVARLTSLKTLSLWGNKLTGEIPSELGQLAGLEQLILDGNDLEGVIPDELGNSNLKLVALHGNRLCGTVPNFGSSLSACTLSKMDTVVGSGNCFTCDDADMVIDPNSPKCDTSGISCECDCGTNFGSAVAVPLIAVACVLLIVLVASVCFYTRRRQE